MLQLSRRGNAVKDAVFRAEFLRIAPAARARR
jgi:hypothetical protein